MQTFKNNIVVNGIFLAFLDGQKCAVLPHFYDEIAKALNFPDYFIHYDDLLFEEQYNLEVVNNIFANAISELEDNGKHFSVFTQKS